MKDNSGIAFFPYYTNRIIPGWFDKKLPWRKPSSSNIKESERLGEELLDAVQTGRIRELVRPLPE